MQQRRRKKQGSASAERIQKAYTERNYEIEVIPPKEEFVFDNTNKVLRVAAYCRVSTEEESQESSYVLQVENYVEFIKKHENWEFVDVYADRGISGTSTAHRKRFLEMIQDCQDGKIDLIITKSISRFARNTLDCIHYVRLLKALKPPVGVYFEMNGYNTLDSMSETMLTLLSTVAQGESEQKSEALKWSYRRRFKKGIPVNNMWAIMGYGYDEEGNTIIVEEEAVFIRFMFEAYLQGKTAREIANALTAQGVPTPTGLEVWNPGTITGMLHNEKYCGEMRMQKTVTLDMFTENHRVIKNRGHAAQYIIRDYHPAIVSRECFLRVQERFRNGGNRSSQEKVRPEKIKYKPIRAGSLAGFVPIPASIELIDIEHLKKICENQNSRRNQSC